MTNLDNVLYSCVFMFFHSVWITSNTVVILARYNHFCNSYETLLFEKMGVFGDKKFRGRGITSTLTASRFIQTDIASSELSLHVPQYRFTCPTPLMIPGPVHFAFNCPVDLCMNVVPFLVTGIAGTS